ncbi:hypothetical protein M413DRAFT_31619 [Hebeloma cylindrosporum]|uniref:Mucoidy inhibitor A n=1 Tax=Hebeloma cylindrosporum TaxID=76867 RepID=A0A0C2XF67_HEBCY|nr:hypothetical protein M413DRAFT_31619 [Hebeloma cylindrosporum h7]
MAKTPPHKTHIVELTSITDTKITNVSLYNGRAEITRICTPHLAEGDNQVIISGLPNVLLEESLRVEGHGPCTIHEVSISDMKMVPPTTSSPKLDDLLSQKTRFEKAIARCRKAIGSVETFHGSLDVQHVQAVQLGEMQQGIAAVAEGLDEKLLGLEEKCEEVTKAIAEERKVLGETKVDTNLRKQVSVTIFAERDREVELVLIYGVTNAAWDATYDIYVKTDTKEKPVTFIYKASIQQDTGEAWEDVPLTLETVTPSFGVSIPELHPWTLAVYRPPVYRSIGRKSKSRGLSFGGGGDESRRLAQKIMHRYASSVEEEEGEEELMAYALPVHAPIRNRGLVVSSKGDITATFTIPGLITVPSDNACHNVTITELELDAEMSWISVPKKSPKAHLTAKIKNDSEYTFLSGIASVYVDGSFISRSEVPAVSPQESFDCPLGIDPSIRITYHPRSRKVNRTGFTRKTCSYTFEQRISIFNTKPTSITSLKVLDQLPVSEDSTITVNLTSPPLVLPAANKKGVAKVPEPVKITEGAGANVNVQWDGAEDSDTDPSLLGKEGKLRWVCEVPAQRTIVLALAWEVVCPYGTDVMGLDE